MKNREFLFYMISENQTFPPRGRRYSLKRFDEDASRRFSEHECRDVVNAFKDFREEVLALKGEQE